MNVKELYNFVQSKPQLKQVFIDKVTEHIGCLVGQNQEKPVVKSVAKPVAGTSKAAQVLEFIKTQDGITSRDIWAHFADWKINAVHKAVWELKRKDCIKSKKTGRTSMHFAK